jgi:hypothetical protein
VPPSPSSLPHPSRRSRCLLLMRRRAMAAMPPSSCAMERPPTVGPSLTRYCLDLVVIPPPSSLLVTGVFKDWTLNSIQRRPLKPPRRLRPYKKPRPMPDPHHTRPRFRPLLFELARHIHHRCRFAIVAWPPRRLSSPGERHVGFAVLPSLRPTLVGELSSSGAAGGQAPTGLLPHSGGL